MSADSIQCVITEDIVNVNIDAVIVPNNDFVTTDSTLNDLTDVSLTTLTGDDILVYDIDNGVWVNASKEILSSQYDYTVSGWDDLKSAVESGLYATVYIPDGIYTCTDNVANPLVVHESCKRIIGESTAGVILDFNGAVNTLIENEITAHKSLSIENISIINPTTNTGAVIKGVYEYFFNINYPVLVPLLRNIYIGSPQGAKNYNKNALYGCTGERLNLELEGNMSGLQYCFLVNRLNVKDPYYGFRNCSRVNNAQVLNTIGLRYPYGFYNCDLISNVKTYTGNVDFYGCHGVTNVYSYNGFTVCWISTGLSNFDIVGASNYGMYNCHGIDIDTIGMNGVTGTEYSLCSFNKTYRDDTDNTKIVELGLANITSGVKRTQNYPDNDGTLMICDDLIEPNNNGDLVIEKTSDTTLTFKLKGSDGIVRTSTITLT